MTAYVEVYACRENRSACVSVQLEKLGARVLRRFTRKALTHVVFDGGRQALLMRALQTNIPIVSVLWVDWCVLCLFFPFPCLRACTLLCLVGLFVCLFVCLLVFVCCCLFVRSFVRLFFACLSLPTYLFVFCLFVFFVCCLPSFPFFVLSSFHRFFFCIFLVFLSVSSCFFSLCPFRRFFHC